MIHGKEILSTMPYYLIVYTLECIGQAAGNVIIEGNESTVYAEGVPRSNCLAETIPLIEAERNLLCL